MREIAAIAGVTERTIYKYVAKGGWKRRYQVLPRGEAAASGDEAAVSNEAAVSIEAAVSRGWRRQAAPDRIAAVAPDFAPVKGAGGRFIRREDIGKPYPTGLKATDAPGRGRALAACGKAQRLSRAAQAKAKKEARAEAFIRALDFNARCLADLRRHREAFVKGRVPSALHLRIEGLLIGTVEWSTRRLETFVPATRDRAQPPPRPPAAPPPRYDPDDFRAWLPRAG